MLKRVSALCALGVAVGSMLLQAQDVFVLPGAGSGSGTVAAFNVNPLAELTSFYSGNGSFLVLPTVDATTFYFIADSTTETVASTTSTFAQAPSVVANLPVPATAAVITPDGRRLAVAAGALYLFDTTTNNQLVPGGFSQGGGINTFDVAASLDATTLYVLGSTGKGTSQLTAFNIASSSASANLAIPQAAAAIAVGPNGLLYVSLPGEIMELNPTTLQPTPGGTIGVTGTPSRLVFTPDGQYAVATNQSALAGSTLLIVALANHTVTAPNLGLPQFGGLHVTGTDSVSGFSGTNLYQVALNPISVTQLSVPSPILALTASNEVPTGANGSVQNLFAVTATTIYRINPATNSLASQYPVPSSLSVGALSFTAPTSTTSTSRIASLLTYGANQSILPSAISEPLVVQVLDSNNHPMVGVPVQFQSNSGVLSTTSAVTQANGYAITYLTAPAAAGLVTVTATAASLAANFNIAVTSSAGGANSPVLSILAGQGQLMRADASTALGSAYGSPLEVLVTDSSGNPLPGIPVTFSVPNSNGGTIVNNSGGTLTVNTSSNGTAQVDFLTTNLSPVNEVGYIQTPVTATAPGTNNVVFYITTVSALYFATIHRVTPTTDATLTGTAGSTLPDAVSVQVLSSCSNGCNVPIPNVSLILNEGNLNPSTNPTVSCSAAVGGVVLTAVDGIATCNLVFGPVTGSGSFSYFVGYTSASGFTYPFTVTAGTAAVVQITQGNNQVGSPGQTLPQAFLIHVTDSGGNNVAGAPVTWQVLPAGAATLSNVSSTTNSNGNAGALATLGNTAGAVQVQVTVGGVAQTFNITINVPSSGIQKVSGDQQTTVINTAFPSPLTVEVVNSNGAGVSGAPVTFQVTSGTATLGTPSVSTGSNGQASTTVMAGGAAGTITVSATSATFNVTFTLTAQLQGASNITIVNGASFSPGTGVSPGGIATISGTGFLPGVQGLVTANNILGPLPLTLGGVTITFGAAATPAPIYYVQSVNGIDQVTVQVPFEVQPGPAVPLTISITNGTPTTVNVAVKPFAPGVFTTVYGGKTYAVALRPDGSYVSPTNPAQLGENISVFVTGLGQVTPATATGDAGVPGQSLVPNAKGALPLLIGLNNGGVPVISAEYAPGFVGVYVITLQVPANTKTGPYQPLGVIAYDSANKAYFANSTYIPIQ
jgi:uncharacterized protein (TIGR03437 family)